MQTENAMSNNSSIEWTDATWQVTTGCQEVSPGCTHCYARTMATRLRAMALADIAAGRYPGKKRYYIDAVDDSGRWTKRVIPRPDMLGEPFLWRKPRMVFVDSMSDLFHEDVPAGFIADVFAVMEICRRHKFQVLTKRPRRMREFCNVWSPRNVWLGTSVEDQRRADERIPHLLETTAAVRFISAEPLLAPVDLCRYLPLDRHNFDEEFRSGLAWVIIGCESGPKRRPFKIEWAESIVDQCRAAGVACFVKQLPVNGKVSHDLSTFPTSLRVREYPKSQATERRTP